MRLHVGLCLQDAHGWHASNVVDSPLCDSIPHHRHFHDAILPASNSQQGDAAAMLASKSENSARSPVRSATGTHHLTLAVFAFGASCATSTVARAAEETIYAAPDSSLVMGLGYIRLKGNELVYSAAGNRISHLIWETDAPVLTTGFKAELVDNWTISASAAIGFSGDSHMEDYDWTEPWGFDRGDWSHRSIHTHTDLDRYINLDIAAGRDFVINDAAAINLHGGFKYTDVKWTAFGGSFTYSVDGFRDTTFHLPDGERGISYEQQYPGVFLGVEAITKFGNWTLSGLLRGGLSVDASDVDNHWHRKVLFKEEFSALLFVSVGAKAIYQVTDRVSFFFAGNFDKYFREIAEATEYDRSTSSPRVDVGKDVAGMDLYAFTLSTGFKFKF
ncbi:omptin family outer membrane protease [Sinorhizobium chiapasense]|uniref:Omptin family outer membrane protease n=1 Tax=Sinorhizobium chiapasense TaxID=501572 RepID=A0ABZ2BJN6_9HYPH